MRLVDTHCHLDFPAFDADRDAVLAACRAGGVDAIVVPGVNAATWPRLEALCAARPGLYPAFGLHPVFLDDHGHGDVAALEAAVAVRRPLAIGEIGLDHHLDGLDRDRQRALFVAQLAVARDAGLPVLLHVRKAHEEALAALAATRVPGGIAHAFNGSLQQAGRYLDLGFRLGFGGMLTYARSRKLRALARDLPAEALVLETDAPDMTVASQRGGRNSPAYLPEVLAALASVRDADPAEVARQTTANARAVLDLD